MTAISLRTTLATPSERGSRPSKASAAIALLALASLVGCTVGPIECEEAAVCEGMVEITCASTAPRERDCAALSMACEDGHGCVACRNGEARCDGNTIEMCRPDRSGFAAVEVCDPALGRVCVEGQAVCRDRCAEAAILRTSAGCEFFPTVTRQAGLERVFEGAVVVSTDSPVDTVVSLWRGDRLIAEETLSPGQTRVIEVPDIPALRGPRGSADLAADHYEGSILVRNGAYRLTSTAPIVAYQYNPLEYSIGAVRSYSNDASLLLPTHTLSGNYTVAAYPTLAADSFDGSPELLRSQNFFSIVGVDDEPVEVTILFAGDVEGSDDGLVESARRGETRSYTVGRGDVLQFLGAAPAECEMYYTGVTHHAFCMMGREHDLTGSRIRATGRVAVFSGHNCANVPYYRGTCDHLEEQMVPEDTWGHAAIVARTRPQLDEPNLLRVVSGADDNMISFDPPVHDPVVLHHGQVLEFEFRQDMRVEGSGPLLVSQFLVGSGYDPEVSVRPLGDPAFALVVPEEQYLAHYTFLAPRSYDQHYLTVTQPMDATVHLDDVPLGPPEAIGETGLGAVRIPIDPGSHTIDGDAPFGIQLYGFGSDTSYYYPGGLDLEPINLI